MTTVINFNILNFFRRGLDQYGFKDARPDSQLSQERQNSSAGRDRVIDVTPSSRVLYDESETATYSRNARQAWPLVPKNSISETYDRMGNSVQFVYQKGLHVDAYV